jgi:hypothetical protein
MHTIQSFHGIQFNPDKTSIEVLNVSVKRSVDDMRADVWQGPFKLGNKLIEVVDSVKILGQILSSKDNDEEHINIRMKTTNVMLGRIQAMNLNSKLIHPNMKAHLFKTYIRPVLCYGTKILEPNGNELLEFKKLEGNAIKRLLRIPVRCKTTDLVDSLNIEQSNKYLHRTKLKFVIRLYKNDYTRAILEFQTEMKLNESFIMEIASFLKLSFDFELETLISATENKITELKAIRSQLRVCVTCGW